MLRPGLEPLDDVDARKLNSGRIGCSAAVLLAVGRLRSEPPRFAFSSSVVEDACWLLDSTVGGDEGVMEGTEELDAVTSAPW